VEAKNFDSYEEMIAWEKELEGRIAAQVGELPREVGIDVRISEQEAEYALAALSLLCYAFVNNIKVDADLVKPAIDFWARQFFPDPYSYMFAGRWLSAEQIEEIFGFAILDKPEYPAELLQELEPAAA